MIKENIYSNQESHNQEFYDKMVDKLIERIESQKSEIGRGRTAHVLVLEKDRRYCLKIITNKNISKNSVAEELKLLDILAEAKIPISHPIRATLKDDGNDYLLMEAIKVDEHTSMSLEDLILKNQADILPQEFDFKDFFKKLRDIVAKMNNQLNIHHRDLHIGNIMINEQGDPVLIDFGDTDKVLGGDEQADTHTTRDGKTTIVPSDISMIDKAQKQIKEYLLSVAWKPNQ